VDGEQLNPIEVTRDCNITITRDFEEGQWW
jgi:hypothetical protein